MQLPPFILFCDDKERRKQLPIWDKNMVIINTVHSEREIEGGRMARAKKHKAPSRIKYEQSHPTVTCRVSKDIHDRLVKAKVEGNSFTDILKLGLGILEVRVKKLGEAKKQGWDEGYKKGFADAKLRYKVIYHCSVCRHIIEVISKEEKNAISEYMQVQGWAHAECLESR